MAKLSGLKNIPTACGKANKALAVANKATLCKADTKKLTLDPVCDLKRLLSAPGTFFYGKIPHAVFKNNYY